MVFIHALLGRGRKHFSSMQKIFCSPAELSRRDILGFAAESLDALLLSRFFPLRDASAACETRFATAEVLKLENKYAELLGFENYDLDHMLSMCDTIVDEMSIAGNSRAEIVNAESLDEKIWMIKNTFIAFEDVLTRYFPKSRKSPEETGDESGQVFLTNGILETYLDCDLRSLFHHDAGLKSNHPIYLIAVPEHVLNTYLFVDPVYSQDMYVNFQNTAKTRDWHAFRKLWNKYTEFKELADEREHETDAKLDATERSLESDNISEERRRTLLRLKKELLSYKTHLKQIKDRGYKKVFNDYMSLDPYYFPSDEELMREYRFNDHDDDAVSFLDPYGVDRTLTYLRIFIGQELIMRHGQSKKEKFLRIAKELSYEAIRESPDLRYGYVLLAEVYALEGRYDRALEIMNKYKNRR